jgi:excisionase family DNA binding protein
MAKRGQTNGQAHTPARRWISIAQAIEYSGLSESTIRRLLDAGRLTRHKPVRRVLVDASELDALIVGSMA